MFSPSERYSTFLAKEDRKQKKEEEEKKTQRGADTESKRRGTNDFKNQKKEKKEGEESKSLQSKSLQLETEYEDCENPPPSKDEEAK